MKCLFGALFFALIVGTTIFVGYYFVVIPELPAFQDSSNNTKSQVEIMEKMTSPIVYQVLYNPKTQKVSAEVGLNTVYRDINVSYILHFFEMGQKSVKYLFSKKLYLTVCQVRCFTESKKIESLVEIKSLKNISIIGDFDIDYNEKVTPKYYPELAIPLSISQSKN